MANRRILRRTHHKLYRDPSSNVEIIETKRIRASAELDPPSTEELMFDDFDLGGPDSL